MMPIGLLSLVLYVELGFIAKSGPLPIDTTVALWFKAHRTPKEVQVAQVISALTTPIIVFSAIVTILLFLNYWTRSWYPRDFIPLALVATAAILTTVSKPFFDRVRPGAGLATLFEFEPSYPSSHTVYIAAAGCALLLYADRRQFIIFMAVSVVTVIIGIVRLILGLHWLTDIVGGTFLAWGLLILFYVLGEALAEKERESL